jgi:23S rRNA pseudouridine1911/1915/1917 synthase
MKTQPKTTEYEYTMISPMRIDRFISKQFPELSRSKIQKMIINKQILVNNSTISQSFSVPTSFNLSISIEKIVENVLEPEDLAVQIIYENEHLLVVNKPPGMVVHPGAGNSHGTLVNGLLYLYPQLINVGDKKRPGIVHRLDKDTSGIILVAKTNTAYLHLSNELKQRNVKKIYYALVKGIPTEQASKIEGPISRNTKNRKKMSINFAGKTATTFYKTIKTFTHFTLVQAEPETGRTHQIRVHMSAIGHPIAGDNLYGGKVSFLNRQFLHAYSIEIVMPESNVIETFTAELPVDLTNTLENLV